jgi:organic hydroperoxide reductase OsmC/OhrA
MIHNYDLTIKWTGNNGTGTSGYTAYERSHVLSIKGKPDLFCSSDKPFRGDGTKHNPEDFLLASLSSCHMLWYLHLCSDAGVIVVDYIDNAHGVLEIPPTGKAKFTSVTLRPIVIVKDVSMIDKANALHELANEKCFIASSVNFPVHHEPTCEVRSL